MSNDITYWLNSLAWFLGGCVLSAIYWRVVIHRMLRDYGATKKETPLSVFTAVIAIVVVVMGVLFDWSNRLAFDDFVHCNANVAQNNVETINDRSRSAADQLRAEIGFYESLLRPSAGDPRRSTAAKIRGQIHGDKARLRELVNNPLQPVTDCHTLKQ